MSGINYISDLVRQCHHVKKETGGETSYEPTMVIYRPNVRGKSIMIPLEAMWKYIEPKDNRDAIDADMEDFRALLDALKTKKRQLHHLQGFKAMPAAWAKLVSEAESLAREIRQSDVAVSIAIMANKNSGMLLCTAFNLAMFMQHLEIEPNGKAAAQLLMFIQDGLDELKNMPEKIPEKLGAAGEVTLFEGSTKVTTREIDVTDADTDMLTEG